MYIFSLNRQSYDFFALAQKKAHPTPQHPKMNNNNHQDQPPNRRRRVDENYLHRPNQRGRGGYRGRGRGGGRGGGRGQRGGRGGGRTGPFNSFNYDAFAQALVQTNAVVYKDLIVGHTQCLFEITPDNLEHLKNKSSHFLKNPLMLNCTQQELPTAAVQNCQIRHLIFYIDGSFHNGLDMFEAADVNDGMHQQNMAAHVTRVRAIQTNLENVKNFYQPKGFVYLMTRKQTAASAFAAAAHNLNFSVVQLEADGFKAIDDIPEERSKVQTVLNRLHSQLRLRGSGDQLRANENLDYNQVIQL